MISSLLQSRIQTLILATVAFLMALVLVLYPEQAVTASLRGLTIWWDVVFPSLLPFFITAEMMIGFGVVHFLGVLLEPLMRPIFRVPGAGAFVMAVGYISGNPMGAKLTARLREQNLITREEGERLIAFTSTASPLFIFGAIAVGFFENPALGVILALAHYSSSILVGIFMRFYKRKSPSTAAYQTDRRFILLRAARAMHQARIKDGRPLGQLLGEAVNSAVQTLLMIGGFIILFSVLIHLIHYTGIHSLFAFLISQLFTLVALPSVLSEPVLAGLLEMTLGSQMISATPIEVPLVCKLALVSLILGWNGFSIHAQIASMISKTDLRYQPYFGAKMLHGILACLMTLLIWGQLLQADSVPNAMPVFVQSMKINAFAWWNYCQQICMGIGILWLVYTMYRFLKTRTR